MYVLLVCSEVGRSQAMPQLKYNKEHEMPQRAQRRDPRSDMVRQGSLELFRFRTGPHHVSPLTSVAP